MRAFLHLKGTKQAKRHSEYEVEMAGIKEIKEVENGRLFNGYFLQVIDEDKPVYAVIYGIDDDKVWKFDQHIERESSGSIRAIPVYTSDIGAILSAEHRDYDFSEVLLGLRRGEEQYYAGDISLISGKINLISFRDLLQFIAGELKWEDLKIKSRKTTAATEAAKPQNLFRKLKNKFF